MGEDTPRCRWSLQSITFYNVHHSVYMLLNLLRFLNSHSPSCIHGFLLIHTVEALLRPHRSNIDFHMLQFAIVTFVLFQLFIVFTHRDRLNLRLVHPKADDCPFSVQSTILYVLLKLTCYAFVQPCSSGAHSFKTCQ